MAKIRFRDSAGDDIDLDRGVIFSGGCREGMGIEGMCYPHLRESISRFRFLITRNNFTAVNPRACFFIRLKQPDIDYESITTGRAGFGPPRSWVNKSGMSLLFGLRLRLGCRLVLFRDGLFFLFVGWSLFWSLQRLACDLGNQILGRFFLLSIHKTCFFLVVFY